MAQLPEIRRPDAAAEGTARARAGVVLLAALLLAACATPPSAPTTAPLRVLAVGDSITRGVPAGGFHSYVDVAREVLGPEFEVVNLGKGGASTHHWVPGAAPGLFESLAVPRLPAAFATVLLGTNDAQRFRAPQKFAADLRSLVRALLDAGAGTVVVLTPPPMAKANARYLPFYREEIHRICAERERIHCGPDLLELVTLGHLIDGLHPNAQGDAVIGEAVAETLRALATRERPARRRRPRPGATR